MVFNEITKEAVKAAFKEPRTINVDLVDAQQARRILDRLVGYSISLFYGVKSKRFECWSCAICCFKMIIDRENEIREFKPEEYWSIDGNFQKVARNSKQISGA